MNISNYNQIDEFWNNDFIIDIDNDNINTNFEKDTNKVFSDYSDSSDSNFSNISSNINYNENLIKSNFNFVNSIKPDNTIFINNNISRTKSENNFLELELFESKIPKELSTEKKMSLLIVVLLQMIFNENDTKLQQIYDFLNKKNILDLEVTKKKYSGIRQSLSTLIGSVNNLNNFNVENNINLKSKNQEDLSSYSNLSSFSNLSIQNYTNKYRTNFNQIKLLGQGSYGSVYKVFHKFEKKFYAIKKIFITNDIIEDNYNIFGEIQIYSDLNHKNIVRYYSSWVDIDFESIIEYNNQIDKNELEPINYICPILFIQMELCDFTLKEYLLTYSSSDSIENKIDLILGIINGLEYLGQKNIIHRDIKPDNIFLIRQTDNIDKYTIKLGDFGLCKKYIQSKNKIQFNSTNEIINNQNNIYQNEMNKIKEFLEIKNLISIKDNNQDDLIEFEQNQIELYNKLTSYVGTGIYRAPEINTGFYDHRIDIYSLGIIILELFIDFKTQSEKIFTVSKIIKKENIKCLDKIININIKNIITNCLELLPEKRNDLEYIKNHLIK